MSVKPSLALSVSFGVVAVLAACQATFQASAGSNTTPSTPTAAAGAPATAATPAPTVAEATPVATATTTTATPPPAAPSKVSLAGGKIVVQGALAFDSGRPILLETPENAALLSDLKVFLEQNPKITQMRIEGHTDNTGDANANIELSGQRALAIKTALVAKGAAKERLLAVGFGGQKPIADNSTDAGRAQNQRIEYRVATWNGKNYLNQDPKAGAKVFE